jgi:probable HAF family extracellular repeat protein
MTRFGTSSLALMAVLAAAVGLPAAAAAPAAAATTYTITDLGSLGGGVTHGLAINASGQVTGDSVSSQLVQIPCPPRQYGGQKKCFTHPDDAFEWSNGTMTDLGTLGGNSSQGVAINGSGQVVGTSQTSTGAEDGFLWSNGTMTDLGPNIAPAAVNDNGQIVANAADTATGQTHTLLLNPS